MDYEAEKFYCEECEAEFEIIHEEINTVGFCPFCGSLLKEKDRDLERDFDDE